VDGSRRVKRKPDARAVLNRKPDDLIPDHQVFRRLKVNSVEGGSGWYGSYIHLCFVIYELTKREKKCYTPC
jgi:hypothetical protein